MKGFDRTTDSEAPDLAAPVVGFRDWRVTAAGLCSPHTGSVWTDAVVRARCIPQRAEDLLRPAHPAPCPGCSCGIHAYYEPSEEFSKVDFRGVSGIVSLWGHLEANDHGMRAEFARVECLGAYRHWTRRQNDAVLAVADRLGCDLVELEDLPAVAERYAERLPASLLPRRCAVRRQDTRPLAMPATERSVLVEG